MFDLTISREQAIYLILNGIDSKYNFNIMCKEYGQDEDWEEVNMESINEENTLDEDYQTFAIWLSIQPPQRTEVVNILDNLF